MTVLTLARYILEFALMDYATVSCSESKLGAAALFIAMRMNHYEEAWSDTLRYYTGNCPSSNAPVCSSDNSNHRCKLCPQATKSISWRRPFCC